MSASTHEASVSSIGSWVPPNASSDTSPQTAPEQTSAVAHVLRADAAPFVPGNSQLDPPHTVLQAVDDGVRIQALKSDSWSTPGDHWSTPYYRALDPRVLDEKMMARLLDEPDLLSGYESSSTHADSSERTQRSKSTAPSRLVLAHGDHEEAFGFHRLTPPSSSADPAPSANSTFFQTRVCCGKEFPTLSEWNHHARYHNPTARDKPCSLCDQLFIFEKDLKRHMRSVHSKERHLLCNVIGCKYHTQGFARGDHLKRHMRTHQGPAPADVPMQRPPDDAQHPHSERYSRTATQQGSSKSRLHTPAIPSLEFWDHFRSHATSRPGYGTGDQRTYPQGSFDRSNTYQHSEVSATRSNKRPKDKDSSERGGRQSRGGGDRSPRSKRLKLEQNDEDRKGTLPCLHHQGDWKCAGVCTKQQDDIYPLHRHMALGHGWWCCLDCFGEFTSDMALRNHKPIGQCRRLCLNPECPNWNTHLNTQTACRCNSRGRRYEKWVKLFETRFPGKPVSQDMLDKRREERARELSRRTSQVTSELHQQVLDGTSKQTTTSAELRKAGEDFIESINGNRLQAPSAPQLDAWLNREDVTQAVVPGPSDIQSSLEARSLVENQVFSHVSQSTFPTSSGLSRVPDKRLELEQAKAESKRLQADLAQLRAENTELQARNTHLEDLYQPFSEFSAHCAQLSDRFKTMAISRGQGLDQEEAGQNDTPQLFNEVGPRRFSPAEELDDNFLANLPSDVDFLSTMDFDPLD